MCKFTCIKVLKKYEAYAEKLKAITDIIGEKQITKARESDVQRQLFSSNKQGQKLEKKL